MALYLYLPQHGSPPYQTVIYYPGAVAQNVESVDQYRTIHLDFILKSGRAVAFPVYTGTFERRLKAPPNGPIAVRDLFVQSANDLRRSIDYLETRRDLRPNGFAYYGYSAGGALAPIFLFDEPRIRAAILYMAGFYPDRLPPEIEPSTFAPRLKLPIKMLSARLDDAFPLATSAVPFFQRLGTPGEHKQHVIAEGGHIVDPPTLMRETLDWLDKYLGKP